MQKTKAKPKKGKHTACRVKEWTSSDTESGTSEDENDRHVVARIERSWARVEGKAYSHKYVYKIQEKPGKKRQSKRVKMKVGGKRIVGEQREGKSERRSSLFDSLKRKEGRQKKRSQKLHLKIKS